MKTNPTSLDRRNLLTGALAAAATATVVPSAFAQTTRPSPQSTRTTEQESRAKEGKFQLM
jgi:hypothetical protein